MDLLLNLEYHIIKQAAGFFGAHIGTNMAMWTHIGSALGFSEGEVILESCIFHMFFDVYFDCVFSNVYL